MPAGDGTGPQGKGPMTGRGQGDCILPVGRAPRTPMPTGYGRGVGRGAGWGMGRRVVRRPF